MACQHAEHQPSQRPGDERRQRPGQAQPGQDRMEPVGRRSRHAVLRVTPVATGGISTAFARQIASAQRQDPPWSGRTFTSALATAARTAKRASTVSRSAGSPSAMPLGATRLATQGRLARRPRATTMPRSPLASSTKLPGGYRPVARSSAPPTSSGTPSEPRQASRAACTGDIGARVRRRLILAVKMSARRSSRASCRSCGSSASGIWPSPLSWCRRTVSRHSRSSRPASSSSCAPWAACWRICSRMAGVSVTSLAASWSCSAAMATFMLSAAQPRLRCASAGQPSTCAACSHTSITSSAWWLLYFSTEWPAAWIRWYSDASTWRWPSLLARSYTRRTRAMNSAFGCASRSAASSSVARLSHWSGSGTSAPAASSRAGCLRARVGNVLQRRVLPQHGADGGTELAPPFVGLVLVGEQRLRAQVFQLLGAGDRSRRPPAASRPSASRTPKGSGSSRRRCSAEKGMSFKASAIAAASDRHHLDFGALARRP